LTGSILTTMVTDVDDLPLAIPTVLASGRACPALLGQGRLQPVEDGSHCRSVLVLTHREGVEPYDVAALSLLMLGLYVAG